MRLLAIISLAVFTLAAPSDSWGNNKRPEEIELEKALPQIIAIRDALANADEQKKAVLNQRFVEIISGIQTREAQAAINEALKGIQIPPSLQRQTPSQPTDGRETKPPVDLAKPSLPPGTNELDRIYWDYQSRQRPDDPQVWFRRALGQYDNKDYEGARDSMDRAIRLGLMDPDALEIYGRSSFHLKDYKTAEKAFSLAYKMQPSRLDLADLGKLSAARTSNVNMPSALDKVGIQSSGGFGGGQGQAGALGSAGGAAGANSSAMTAAEIAAQAARQASAAPDKIQQSAAVTREAGSALQMKDYRAAHALASQAIDMNARNAQAWNLRAIANVKLDRYADAVYDSSFALGLIPGNATALQTRGWAFAKQGQYQAALADANYTLEREPLNGFAYQNRAFALAGIGDRQGALEALRRSAELDPRFQSRYQAALQAPTAQDLLLLFNDEVMTAAPGAAGRALSRGRRFARLALMSALGGVLVALGLLHIVSASWREKVRATIRRVLASPGAATAGATATAPFTGGGAFWTQYEVVKGLGTGGMGVVYEAVDKSLDRRVAIKKMRDEIRLDPVERQRFICEARTVAALHHPNIVDIYSIVEEGADVYLVFEFVAGQTLADLLREKGPLGFAEARRLMKGICEAVDYAHDRKVIHRDLKPSNIMLTDGGVPKVMDFGVARQAKDAMTKMSMTNTVVGTPPYMAPEQEQGGVRRESDVFALAVVFYELVSGELPFSGVGAGMLLNKINGRHAPLSSKAGNLPKGCDEAVARALNPDPDKRYRTAGEFYAALEALPA